MLEQESSSLRRPLPPEIKRALAQRDISEEDVLIATDTDLNIPGAYVESWVLATKNQLLVFSDDDEDGNEVVLLREVPFSEIDTARTDSRVGSGFLEIKTNGFFEELVRFSNKNADKFAKVASFIRNLSEGKDIEVTPEDEVLEGRCRKCGARLPDPRMTICPRCLKKGTVFFRFLLHTRAYWPYAALAMLLVILTILMQLVPAQLTRILVDNVLPENPKPMPAWFASATHALGLATKIDYLKLLVGGLVLATAIGAITAFFRESLAVFINNKLAYDLRKEVFRKIEDLAVRYHDTTPVGQLMTRVTQDVETLQGFVHQITSGFGYQLIMVVSVAVVMFTMDWKMALWATVPAPLVMMSTVVYYQRIVPRHHKFWSSRSSLANILLGTLTGIRVVKAFAQENREAARFDVYSSRYRDAGLQVGYSTARFYPAVSFVFQMGSFFMWFFGGLALIKGDGPEGLTLGTLLAFLAYLAMFYAPLNQLTQMSTWFTSFTTQAHRVFEILDEQPEIDEPKDAIDIEIQGAIAFHDVTFGYDPHIPVLHQVSFRVQPGEMIGVVGHSGSGKSTTVSLVMRFYEPQEGHITIDNQPISRIRIPCLRHQVGLVAQDPFLFRGTIAENIAYGNPDVAPEQVLNAALAANAHMFITRIHDGYDTRLGERGSGLSGGERQRVAIARALVHNPRILILDEATSSVDTLAEREIQKALEALSLGRTVIAVAHRLSTLRNCDRIFVFEEGHIREQGTHEQLLAKGGIYKKLVEIQTQLTSDSVPQLDSPAAIEALHEARPLNRPRNASNGNGSKSPASATSTRRTCGFTRWMKAPCASPIAMRHTITCGLTGVSRCRGRASLSRCGPEPPPSSTARLAWCAGSRNWRPVRAWPSSTSWLSAISSTISRRFTPSRRIWLSSIGMSTQTRGR